MNRSSSWPFGLSALVILTLLGSCASSTRLDTSAMTFSADPLLGKVVWNDLITEDADAARRFYGELFGWTFDSSTGADGRPYWLARSGGIYVAGILAVNTPTGSAKFSRWLPYVSVSDVDAALERASAAGGKVAASARSVGIGRIAAIVDTEGAVIGLARSRFGDPDDRTTRAARGHVVWTELLSDNPRTATEFYRAVVDYDVNPIERRGGPYTMLEKAGVRRAGILKNPSEQWDPVWLTYFGVDDPAVAAARAESLGGKILLPVSSQVREGTMAVVADPSGAILVLQKLPT